MHHEAPVPPAALSRPTDASVGEGREQVVSDDNVGQAIGVVILGMGRSGTSAVTRMFAKAGFYVGAEDDLMPATDANPAGHWENLGIWRINERLLEQLGASWFDPPSVEEQMATRERATPLLKAEIDRLASEAQGLPVALKDPRIGVMLPLWGPILRGRLHPILVVRDPCEIAKSLQRRDGTPIPFGLGAWEVHMTLLVDELANRHVMVLPYASIVGDEQMCRAAVESVIGQLDPALRAAVRPEMGFDAFQPTLRHNRASAADHVENLTGRQLELWRYLSSLSPGNQRLHPTTGLCQPSATALDAVCQETKRLDGEAVQNRLTSKLLQESDRSAQVTAALDAERDRNGQLSAELRAERSRIERLSTELGTARDRAQMAIAAQAAAEHRLDCTQASLSWRITSPLRAAKRPLRSS
jgi:hypothetical protein